MLAPTSCLDPSGLVYVPLSTDLPFRWNLPAAALGPCLHPILLPLRYGNLLPYHSSSMAAERVQLKMTGQHIALARGGSCPNWEKHNCSAPLRFSSFPGTLTRGTFLLKSEPVFCVLPSDQGLVLKPKYLILGLNVCISFKVFLFFFFFPKMGET